MIHELINPNYREKLKDEQFLEQCKEEFEANRVFNVSDLFETEKLQAHMYEFYQSLDEKLKVKTVMGHKEVPNQKELTNGFSFIRVRLKNSYLDERSQENLIELFKQFTLMEFANSLNQFVCPLLSHITSKKQKLVNVGCFIYEEGDYIGIHHDRHRGEHINFQIPVNVNNIGSFRYIKDGLMKLHYDEKGTAKVMSGDIWHEVPPIASINKEIAPVRIVFMLEYRV